jgi:hypothetical protein
MCLELYRGEIRGGCLEEGLFELGLDRRKSRDQGRDMGGPWKRFSYP